MIHQYASPGGRRKKAFLLRGRPAAAVASEGLTFSTNFLNNAGSQLSFPSGIARQHTAVFPHLPSKGNPAMRCHVVAGLMASLAAPALAQDCPLPYSIFEFAVPHVDLEECPGDLGAEDEFCRATLATDHLHVYVFAEDGEQCLREVRSYGDDEFEISIR